MAAARKFKVGDLAIARTGHTVRIVRITREDDVEFAWIVYVDGYLPHDVNGRVCGTVDEPVWEHRIKTGKVVRSGGDYWNPNDWVTEKGLRFLDSLGTV